MVSKTYIFHFICINVLCFHGGLTACPVRLLLDMDNVLSSITVLLMFSRTTCIKIIVVNAASIQIPSG